MTTKVAVPEDLWDDDSEGVITSWFFNSGDTVAKGDLLAEVMVEKAQYEIVAPAAGVLTIETQEDEVVTKGATIAVLRN